MADEDEEEEDFADAATGATRATVPEPAAGHEVAVGLNGVVAPFGAFAVLTGTVDTLETGLPRETAGAGETGLEVAAIDGPASANCAVSAPVTTTDTPRIRRAGNPFRTNLRFAKHDETDIAVTPVKKSLNLPVESAQ
jgi:hypothetical protein